MCNGSMGLVLVHEFGVQLYRLKQCLGKDTKGLGNLVYRLGSCCVSGEMVCFVCSLSGLRAALSIS